MTDDQILTRPIVILGAPRSGTTVLSQLLRKHPDLCLLDEPRIAWKYGNDHRSDMLSPEHATPKIRSYIRGYFAKQVREAGATRLLEKTPSNSLRTLFVDKVLNDCLFVHVMRSGAQSVLSIREFWRQHSTGVPASRLGKRLKEIKLSQAPHYGKEFARRVIGKVVPGVSRPPVWGPRLPGIDAMARDLDLLEVCAMQWRLCVESACRDGRRLPADRYTELRLEELDADQLKAIMAFCGLSESEEVLSAYHEKFDKSAPSGRTKSASDKDIQRVTELTAPTTAWLQTLTLLARHEPGWVETADQPAV